MPGNIYQYMEALKTLQNDLYRRMGCTICLLPNVLSIFIIIKHKANKIIMHFTEKGEREKA